MSNTVNTTNTVNTAPNQKVVIVHRDSISQGESFIQIKKENFYAAYKDLGQTCTILYLYLVGNKEGFELAFSPRAVLNQLGMPESTTRDQINKLIDKGYLVQRKEGSNIYDLYEKPIKE